MFRFLRLIILLALIVGVVMGAYLWISRVPTLERFLSQRLNAKITIEQVKIGVNHITILGLKMKNPLPSSFPNAFQAGEITMEIHFLELLKKTVHIDQIKIQDSTLSLELYNYTGSDNNWARLLLHNELHARDERTFTIDKLILTNVQFNAIRATGKEIPITPIPYLELEKLGENQPLTLSQTGQILFRTILATLTNKPTLGALLDHISTVPDTLLKGITSTHPYEQTRKAMRASLDVIQKMTQKASDFFRNLPHNLLSNSCI